VIRVCVWGDKEKEECIISIDAYCNASEQGNWSSCFWHVHRRIDVYANQRMSVPHGVWLDMLDRHIEGRIFHEAMLKLLIPGELHEVEMYEYNDE